MAKHEGTLAGALVSFVRDPTILAKDLDLRRSLVVCTALGFGVSVACTRGPAHEAQVTAPSVAIKDEPATAPQHDELPRGFDALVRTWPELSAVQYGVAADLSPWFSKDKAGVLYARIEKGRPCEVLHWRWVDGALAVRVLVDETADARSYRTFELSPVLVRRHNVWESERKTADGSWHEEEGLAVEGPPAEALGVLTEYDGEVAWYAGVEMDVHANCAGKPLDACRDESTGCSSCDVVQMSMFEKPTLGRLLASKGAASALPPPSDECLAACEKALDSSELYSHVNAELSRLKQASLLWKRRDPRDSPAIYRSQSRCDAASHGLWPAVDPPSPQ